uniref:Lipid droplet-associated hydrolase n=1 Tax=Megaselia scalaris TaxID=36166 RepID=T1GFJ2_MEGSC
MPSLKGNKDLFNIDGQFRSKTAFIEKFIPSHIKVHLIGHSFGTCQSLDLIRNPKIKKQIQKCYLLFPTFERRKGTKSAKSFNKMYTFYNLIGFALAILFSKLPRILRVFIFSIYLMVKGTDLEYVDSYVMAAETGVMEKS